jgi:hypothetical protein
MLIWLAIVWGGLTAILVVLLIYRGTLTMHEDDQLFLDEAESHMAKEQEDLRGRMQKIRPWLQVFGTCSVVLGVAILGMMIYNQLNQ